MDREITVKNMIAKRRLYATIFWCIVCGITIILAARGLVVTWHSIGDEAHMVATSFRFFLGDAPLVDDWSPEQLNGIVMLPIISMYLFAKGSTEGLFMFMRCFCLCVKLLILVYGYNKLKKENNAFMIFSGLLLWYVFMPFNFDNFTYQVVPIVSLMYCLIVIRSEATSNLEWVIAGIFYAISILSQPFWIMSYIFIVGWVVAKHKIVDIRKVISFHIGIVIVTIAFLFLVFSRASLTELIQNIPLIFKEPDHNVVSQGIIGLVYENIIKVLWKYIWDNKVTTIVNLSYIALLIIMNGKKDKLKVGMWICLLISLVDILLKFSAYTMNWMFIAFGWMAIESLFYKHKKIYTQLLGLGIVYFVSVAIGTNVSYFSSAHSMSMLAFVALFYYDCNDNSVSITSISKVNKVVPVLVVIYALFIHVFICYSEVLSQESYGYRIGVGPMEGLYTNQQNFDRYMSIYNDISEMNLSENDVLFVTCEKPLAYLVAQVEYGTMGTPFFYLDNNRLNLYYEMHPDKVPTKVY